MESRVEAGCGTPGRRTFRRTIGRNAHARGPAHTGRAADAGDACSDAHARHAEPGDRRFLESPWFAKLPPELRNAIRNNAQRRPPRGYEERLKRYFESMD